LAIDNEHAADYGQSHIERRGLLSVPALPKLRNLGGMD
jgi:hypothetical protein